MSLDAMKQALEALQLSKPKLTENTFRYVAHDLAIAALRAAIEQEEKPWVKTYSNGEPQYTTPEEQPEQEPVAWMYVNTDGECEQIEYETPPDDPSITPLYTAPPRREWQGLTGEEREDLVRQALRFYDSEAKLISLAKTIEAKLKEKNT